MRSKRRKPVLALLMSAFLAAHLVCVCAGPALATAMAAGTPAGARHAAIDPHACCHPNDASGSHPNASPGCQHCGHAQLINPETVKFSDPTLSALPAFLAPTPQVGLTLPIVRLDCGQTAGGHAPPPTSSRTSVRLL